MINSDSIQNLILTASLALPLITGVVQVIKISTKLSKRWIPLTSVVIGTIVGVLIIDLSFAGGVAGLIIGLGSIGLWETGKKAITK